MAIADALRLDDTSFEAREFRWLWTVALATYGVGDIVTTVTLLYFSRRVDEMNAVIQLVVGAYGQWGLVGLKFATFLVCITVCVYGARTEDKLLFYLPPTALAVVGAFATAFNIRLFLG
jgi:hypothetical protein